MAREAQDRSGIEEGGGYDIEGCGAGDAVAESSPDPSPDLRIDEGIGEFVLYPQGEGGPPSSEHLPRPPETDCSSPEDDSLPQPRRREDRRVHLLIDARCRDDDRRSYLDHTIDDQSEGWNVGDSHPMPKEEVVDHPLEDMGEGQEAEGHILPSD